MQAASPVKPVCAEAFVFAAANFRPWSCAGGSNLNASAELLHGLSLPRILGAKLDQRRIIPSELGL